MTRWVVLRDVATIHDGYEDPRYLVRTNGEPALLLTVVKRGGTNTVAVADRVRETVGSLRRDLPPGLEARLVSDRGLSVSNLLATLGWNALGGGLIVILMVSLFLGGPAGARGLGVDPSRGADRPDVDAPHRRRPQPGLDLRSGAGDGDAGGFGSGGGGKYRPPRRAGPWAQGGGHRRRRRGQAAGPRLDPHHHRRIRSVAHAQGQSRRLHVGHAAGRDLRPLGLPSGGIHRHPASLLYPVAPVPPASRRRG